MDQIKIGKYIAEKRKALGLTQRELAEKLGMSDKSVSKWERGVCLPDVSVYSELCQNLGISINEFLAGEDIPQENIVRKSEENLIGVAADSKRKQKRLKLVICILLALTLAAVSVLAAWIYNSNKPQNFIAPLPSDSVEMKTAQLLSGVDGAHIFRFTTTDEYKSLKLYFSEYRNGELVDKQDWGMGYGDIGSPRNGMILIVPDFDDLSVKCIVADDYAKLSTDVSILSGVEEAELMGRSSSRIEGETKILYDIEQPLLALIYDRSGLQVMSVYDIESSEALAENDCVYLFSYEFCKE